VLLAGGTLLWVLITDDPLGGEPQAVAPIERLPVPPPSAKAEAPPVRPSLPVVRTEMEPAPDAPPPSGPLIIKIPQNGRGPASGIQSVGAPVAGPDPALLAPSPFGLLPRIAEDGRRPSDVYARPRPVAAEGRPQIAILVALGDDADAVLGVLPRPVGVALSPYPDAAIDVADRARNRGHEVLLQLPMEPFGAADAGPQALKTSLPAQANLDRLHWALGRLGGYFGVVNLDGGRFMADADALRPVLFDVARRGLAVVDDATSPRSALSDVGRAAGAVTAKAELRLGADADAEATATALERLEMAARRGGTALGAFPGSPAMAARLRQWADGLAARGFDLVPVSALVRRTDPS
jgi:polysaccharide deacetylase 2 family uncharacterized protein YibQ